MRSKFIIGILVFAAFSSACQKKSNSSAGAGSDTGSTNGLQSVFYDFDSSVIRSDASATLQGNADVLKSNSDNIVVEGNCDNRGTTEYNLALGQRRAEASKNYLMNLGVPSTRLQTASFGEDKPVCQDSSEQCWQQNRRADFRK